MPGRDSRNRQRQEHEERNPFGICTWQDVSRCADCPVGDALNCRFNRGDLLYFLAGFLPPAIAVVALFSFDKNSRDNAGRIWLVSRRKEKILRFDRLTSGENCSIITTANHLRKLRGVLKGRL